MKKNPPNPLPKNENSHMVTCAVERQMVPYDARSFNFLTPRKRLFTLTQEQFENMLCNFHRRQHKMFFWDGGAPMGEPVVHHENNFAQISCVFCTKHISPLHTRILKVDFLFEADFGSYLKLENLSWDGRAF